MITVGIIGWPVAHSKSPLIHRFWLSKQGIDGDYNRFAVAPENLGEAIRALPKLGLAGVNVTVPYKVAVIDYLDRLHPVADQVGAVNTIIVEPDGTLSGYNTDVAGVADPLRAVGSKSWLYPNHVTTCVQIIGAGGAARAAAVGAHAAGYGVFEVYVRDPAKATPVAQLAGTPFGTATPLALLGPICNADDGVENRRYSHVIINATTLGMTGNVPVAIDLTQYYPDTVVFDMVYAPLETPLLKMARAEGFRTIDGLQMLVAQAAAAFALFTGQPAPREHDAELRALLTA